MTPHYEFGQNYEWDLGWDWGLGWDYDKWDGTNGIWDGIWIWDSPIPINMSGKYKPDTLSCDQ